MSPVLNEAQLRAEWSPKCEHVERAHMVDAWLALDAVMRHHAYAPRQGETYAANCRATTGSTSASLHSFFGKKSWQTWTGVTVQTAVATDFNSTSNPYSTRLITDMPRVMIDDILAIRTNNGVPVFHWGGYFSTHKDAMHFQFCCSPADLATGIDYSTVKGWNGTTQQGSSSNNHAQPSPQEDDMPDYPLVYRVVADNADNQAEADKLAGAVFMADDDGRLTSVMSYPAFVHHANLGLIAADAAKPRWSPSEWWGPDGGKKVALAHVPLTDHQWMVSNTPTYEAPKVADDFALTVAEAVVTHLGQKLGAP